MINPAMIPRIVTVCALLHAAVAAAPSKTPGADSKAPALPLSPRFLQVRSRIDALFSNRLNPPAPLDPRHNPFRPAGAFVPAASSDAAAVAPPPEPKVSDLALLQQSIATLKISGGLEVGGKQHVGINSQLYKEGDVIQIQLQGKPVYLRVKSISPKRLTLALNEAETTVKFP